MRCGDLCDRLDKLLDVGAYAEVDASPNGLQVGARDGTVERVAVAVDAAEATVAAARDAGADLLVTHHGIVWGSVERVTGRTHRRMAPLVEAGMGLYVAHLPLDGHQELGNAAGVGDVLGLVDREPFGALGAQTVGQRGRLPDPATVEEVAATLSERLDTADGAVQALPFVDRVGDVAVVTGAGTDWLDEAADAGVDLLVTGEGKHRVYHEAREAGIGVVLAGHYATETFGVRAVADRLESWGLETTAVDHPTGL